MHASPRATVLTSCLIFLSLGMTSATLGPSLPELASRTGGTLAQLGGIFTALFLGAIVGQALIGPLSDRFGRRPILVAGTVLMVLGLLGVLASRSVPLILAAALLAGIGDGAVVLVGNVMTSLAFPQRTVTILNLVNLFFGLGAFAGPAVVSVALRTLGTALPGLWASIVLLLIVIPLVLLLVLEPAGRRVSLPDNAARGASIFASPLLWVLGSLLFVYVGTETAVGGWTAVYLQRSAALSLETAALATSGFWLALAAGRMLAVGLSSRLSAHALLLLSLAGAAAGGILLTVSPGRLYPSVAAVLLLGLCFGSIYPTVLAGITTTFQRAPGRAAGVAATMGSCGGAAMPWLMGVVLTGAGALPAAAFVLAGTLAMLGLYTASRRLAVPA